MGLLRLYDIPEPRHPTFRINDEDGWEKSIQTGITTPTTIEYYKKDNEKMKLMLEKPLLL